MGKVPRRRANQKNDPKKSRKTGGPLSAILILVLIALLGWQLHQIHQRVDAAKNEQTQLIAQVQDQQAQNDALEQDISEGLSQEKMEEIARRELGYVNEREYVYYDVSN